MPDKKNNQNQDDKDQSQNQDQKFSEQINQTPSQMGKSDLPDVKDDDDDEDENHYDDSVK
jgi:hypothetical protein